MTNLNEIWISFILNMKINSISKFSIVLKSPLFLRLHSISQDSQACS